MDLRGKVQKLNLKGHGKEYFENPELIPSNIYNSEKGYLYSQRQLTKKEREAYDIKFDWFKEKIPISPESPLLNDDLLVTKELKFYDRLI